MTQTDRDAQQQESAAEEALAPPHVLDARLNFLMPFHTTDIAALQQAAAKLATYRESLAATTLDYFTPQTCQLFSDMYRLPAVKADFEVQPAFWDASVPNAEKRLVCNVQIEPRLTLFIPDGIGILSLRLSLEMNEASPLEFVDLLNLNNYFRYYQWPAQLQRDQYRLHLDGRATTVRDWVQALLHQWLGTEDFQLYDPRKLFVFGAAVFDRELTDDEYCRYVTVDSESEDTPQGDAKKLVLEHQSYNRWAQYGTRYGFTHYSGMGIFINPGYVATAGDEYFLFASFNDIYFYVLLVLLFHRARLVQFSNRITKLSAESPALDSRLFSDLHRDILVFTNCRWFEDITYEVQGAEIYVRWRSIINNQALYNEVRQKLAETDDYARAQESQVVAENGERLDRRLFQLQGIFIAGVLFAAAALFVNLLPDHPDRGLLLMYDLAWLIAAILVVVGFVRTAAVRREIGYFHLGRFFGGTVRSKSDTSSSTSKE